MSEGNQRPRRLTRRSFLAGGLVFGGAVAVGIRSVDRWGESLPDAKYRAPSADRSPALTIEHDSSPSTDEVHEPVPADDPIAAEAIRPDQVEPQPPVAEDVPPQQEASPEPTPTRIVDVICRSALGLAAAGAGARPHVITDLMLHHTAVALGSPAGAPARLRGHQRYHQQAGWSDIAYHYGVDPSGNVYELREPGLAGDTFTDYEPAGHLLVVCEGDYNIESPTDAMLQRVAELFAHAARLHGADPSAIRGHRDLAATSCPGDLLQAQLPAIRREAARLVAAERVELASVCGEPGAELVAAIEAGRV